MASGYKLVLIVVVGLISSNEALPIDALLVDLFSCDSIKVLFEMPHDIQFKVPVEIGHNELIGNICVVSDSIKTLLGFEQSINTKALVRVLWENSIFNETLPFESLYNNDSVDFTSSTVISIKKLYQGIAVVKLLCSDSIRHSEHILKHDDSNWSLTNKYQFQCRPNLNDKTLTVVAIGAPPYVNIEENGQITGTDREIIRVLQSREGFGIKYVTEWSYMGFEMDEHGQSKLTGLVGKVYYGEAHLGSAASLVHTSFYSYVDYIVTYSYYMHYKTGKPRNLPPYLNLFKPFSATAWIVILLTLIVVSLTFMVLSHFLNSRNKDDMIRYSFVIIMSQFCQGEFIQCYACQLLQCFVTVIPTKKTFQYETRTGMKLFLITWYIYTFFIHASYDCNLRAYLMHVDSEKPIDTAKDIVDQSRKVYFFSQHDESAMHEALPENTFKYEKLYAKRSYENGYQFAYPEDGYEPAHILRLMIDEGIVIFSAGIHELRRNSNKDMKRFGYLPFRLSKYPTRIHPKYAGLVIAKYSALKAIFEPVIMRLNEADIIEHYSRSTYYYWKPEKEELPKTPLNLEHMLIGYVIYIIGVAISILAFFMEMPRNRKTLNYLSAFHNALGYLYENIILFFPHSNSNK